MSRACSVSARGGYGKARVYCVLGVARSTQYAREAARGMPAAVPKGRGRPPTVSDEALVASIHEALREV